MLKGPGPKDHFPMLYSDLQKFATLAFSHAYGPTFGVSASINIKLRITFLQLPSVIMFGCAVLHRASSTHSDHIIQHLLLRLQPSRSSTSLLLRSRESCPCSVGTWPCTWSYWYFGVGLARWARMTFFQVRPFRTYESVSLITMRTIRVPGFPYRLWAMVYKMEVNLLPTS